MVFGSDAGVMPKESAGGQFRGMVEYGMTPLEAIRAATLNAAEALGQGGQVGTLRPGAFADLVAIAGDPLADVGELAELDHVMKGGEVVR
jgi:imidazolonepropionase-like amidohydrolase